MSVGQHEDGGARQTEQGSAIVPEHLALSRQIGLYSDVADETVGCLEFVVVLRFRASPTSALRDAAHGDRRVCQFWSVCRSFGCFWMDQQCLDCSRIDLSRVVNALKVEPAGRQRRLRNR